MACVVKGVSFQDEGGAFPGWKVCLSRTKGGLFQDGRCVFPGQRWAFPGALKKEGIPGKVGFSRMARVKGGFFQEP
jgi:hypothetical protein